jgi:hypothetical protein
MSTVPGQIMGKPSVKTLRKRLSGRVADHPGTAWVVITMAFRWNNSNALIKSCHEITINAPLETVWRIHTLFWVVGHFDFRFWRAKGSVLVLATAVGSPLPTRHA